MKKNITIVLLSIVALVSIAAAFLFYTFRDNRYGIPGGDLKMTYSKDKNDYGFHTIAPKDLDKSPWKMLAKDWMLILGEKDSKQNAMTASWGGMGVVWGKDTTLMVIRPQRYTLPFIDGSETYSLNFFDETHRKTLGYMGRVSGRDENKIEKSGLTVVHDANGTPYFKEAKTVFICKKLYRQQMTSDSFIDKSIIDEHYEEGDFHYTFVGEIQQILIKP